MLLTALALAAAAPLQLPPIDTCAKDRSFVEFRTNLRRIIRRRDSPAMMRVVADDIYYGRPDMGHGRDRFVASWAGKQLGDPSWRELRAILDLGCVLRGGRAFSPSFGYQLKEFESLTSTLAVPGAVVRSRPSKRAPIIARSNWLVLTELEEADGDWIGVQLTNGRRGFIEEAMTAVTGITVSFEKRDGRWVMTGWTSGD